MELYYDSFDNVEIDKEIEKIKQADIVNVRVSTTDKDILFLLGILFAMGKKINITNKNDLDLSSNSKSFYIMAYVWEKLGDSNYPLKDYSDVNTDLDILITNLKNLGFEISPLNRPTKDNKKFLISPVRNVSPEQTLEIESFKKDKVDAGFDLHVPQKDTFQKDKFGGYSICFQNANAIAESTELYLYYDQTSKGSMFDLGIAYYLNKPLTVINKDSIDFDQDDFGDQIVINWDRPGSRLILK